MSGRVCQCPQCGAPRVGQRECEYCGSVFYLGPELPNTKAYLDKVAVFAYESHYTQPIVNFSWQGTSYVR